MAIPIPKRVLEATTRPALKDFRAGGKQKQITYGDKDPHVDIDETLLDKEDIEDLIKAAETTKETKVRRACQAILSSREEDPTELMVPSFLAFEPMLRNWLHRHKINGWIFVEESDGHLYPQLVTRLEFKSNTYNKKGTPEVLLQTVDQNRNTSSNSRDKISTVVHNHVFRLEASSRKKLKQILNAHNIHGETPELIAKYEANLKRHDKLTENYLGKQFRLNGYPIYSESKEGYRQPSPLETHRKVIADLALPHEAGEEEQCETNMWTRGKNESTSDQTESGVIPRQPVMRVFNLATHVYCWTNSINLTPYVYDKTLREKLILPQTHRDLLDILTADIEMFTEDIIEGKSAGNIILCKGRPGVGKTLTAEVYAELTDKPLYKIHTGSLGTKASEIEKHLEHIFLQAQRWECVLLLDEADVFISKRGENIEKNAIVAEFLRALEYFPGLLFMTTNRPADVDDAIISRCAAIIQYPEKQDPKDMLAVWEVLTQKNAVSLPPETLAAVVKNYANASPRDVKMLLRLALRMANFKTPGEMPGTEIFRQCALFRGMTENTPEK